MRKLARFFLYLLAATVFSAAQADSFSDFFRAARSDNASGIESLLRRGFDPNTRDEHGMTGLLIAIREPSPRVIQALLASPQTNVDLRNGNDESPLMLAAIKGQMDLVKQLIARNAEINKPGHIGVFQSKLEFPTANNAMRIPLSFTYSNRTELINESDVRGQIGISFNLDSLFVDKR